MVQLPPRMITWLSSKQVIIEIVLVALAVVAFAFKFLELAGGEEMLMIVLLTLASFYFPVGLFMANAESQAVRIPMQIFSISSAVCVVGILFTFLRLPGAKEQLMIGLIGLAVSALALIFLVVTGRAKNLVHVIIRLIVLGGLCLNAYMGLNNVAPQ
jgi:hypothetical protein